jgi:hypothetical protein
MSVAQKRSNGFPTETLRNDASNAEELNLERRLRRVVK